MADGFIVRKGGVTTEQTLAPTITKVSQTGTTITFTLKNNDAATATLVYRYSSLTGDGESISLATNTTSSNITVSSITLPGTLFVTANSIGKVKSNVVKEEYEITFTAATGGTTLEYDSGGKRFRSHTFTSNGNFVVNTVGDNVDDRNKVDYLIIAAGGGSDGDTINYPGGGGAGGYRTTIAPTPNDVTPDSKVTVTATTFAVTIGAGGAGNTGGNSEVAFASTITSLGGGRSLGATVGQSGGSGSGGGLPGGGTLNGGAGTTGQGFAGGSTLRFSIGGGGGASQVGGSGTATADGGKNGGNGLANTLRDGTSEIRGGGGGGASWFSNMIEPQGGTGGGGNGAFDLGNATSVGQNGTANTGGGAGANAFAKNNGGSGIVVIRYEIAPSV